MARHFKLCQPLQVNNGRLIFGQIYTVTKMYKKNGVMFRTILLVLLSLQPNCIDSLSNPNEN